jgi:carnitine O-acetyltransferase
MRGPHEAESSGNGFDRHLYALNCITKQLSSQDRLPAELKGEIPELFRDAGYATINHTVLSTSNCGNPALRLFGFGPVAADGFGLGYIIKDDALSICAASKHLQTSRFLDTLSKYLKDMQNILIDSYKAANVRTVQTYIDHQGRECDIRTGLPIGSNQHMSNGYDLGDEEGTGISGYSFYGDQSEQAKKAKEGTDSRSSRIAGVGRMLIHNEYA